MSSTTAIVDATRHTDENPADLRVAGLGLLERTVRVGSVSGCDRALLLVRPSDLDRAEQVRRRIADDDRFAIEVTLVETDRSALSDTLSRAVSELDALQHAPDRILYLDSTAVYDRGALGRMLASIDDHGGVCWPDGPDATDPERAARLFAADRPGWRHLCEAASSSAPSSIAELPALVDRSTNAATRSLEVADRDVVRVTDARDGERAADEIWAGCYKAVDGPVGRYVNRHVSLAISRVIAPYDISPNQVSAVAGLFGLLAAPVAAIGGYWAFLAAAVCYQLKSIIDGTDGEIARAKYEFTDLGAWLDKFFDDLSDMAFALGAAFGAWQIGLPGPGSLGPDFWLSVIGVTLLGKAICSVVFYGAIIRHGELVHPKEIFDWWFEEEDEKPAETFGARLFAYVKPVTKGDVFTFLAFLCAIVGIVPVYLTLFAIGQMSVGISRLVQARLQTREPESVSSRAEA